MLEKVSQPITSKNLYKSIITPAYMSRIAPFTMSPHTHQLNLLRALEKKMQILWVQINRGGARKSYHPPKVAKL